MAKIPSSCTMSVTAGTGGTGRLTRFNIYVVWQMQELGYWSMNGMRNVESSAWKPVDMSANIQKS